MTPSLSYRLPLVLLFLTGTILWQSSPLRAQTDPPPKKKSGAQAKQTTPPLARKGRETQVIDGAWKFQTDPQNMGEQEGWAKAAPTGAKEITVPSLWTTQAATGYSGAAWYWREIEAPPSWKTQTVRLRFEAVAEKASVWLNGVKLGDHEGGATPFEFNITKELVHGMKNVLAVRVEGEAQRGAGIWQGVLLMAHDEAYMSEVSLTAGGLGQLSSAVTFENTSENSGVAVLQGRLIELNKPDKEVHHSEQNLSLTPGRNVTTMLTSIGKRDLHTWSLETPTLYALQLVFRQNMDLLDTQQTSFGFREFGWKDNTITLNGLPFKLTSVAPAFSHPIVVASTEDAERARASLQHLKDAGVTILYLDAPPPELLHVADTIGLLIVESARPGQSPQTAFDELQALMLRDRSHPSVLAWRTRDADPTQVTKLRASDPSRFVLIEASGTAKLYLPGEAATEPVPVPPGFLPAH